MTGPQRGGAGGFDPRELGTTDPADLADAMDAARRLQATIEDLPIVTGRRFSDRVMAALANEPTPAPTGFLAPLRRLGLIGGFGASVRQAWASIGTPGRPTFARAAALAYILAIAIAGTSLAGAATIGVAGAMGLLGPHPAQPVQSTGPFESSGPDASEQPSGESEPPGSEPSDGASDGPDASDDHGGAGGSEPSDDTGGNSGPGSTSGSGGGDGSDDGSGGSSGSGSDGGASATSTPRPTQTPRPTGTPKPTETLSSSD